MSPLRSALERASHRTVVCRRLPAPFAAARIYASSEGGLRYLGRGMAWVDPALLRLAAETVGRGDTVWDIGANVALQTKPWPVYDLITVRDRCGCLQGDWATAGRQATATPPASDAASEPPARGAPGARPAATILGHRAVVRPAVSRHGRAGSRAAAARTQTDVETELQLVTSASVQQAVRSQMGSAPAVSASDVGQTNVIAITATSPVPSQAAQVANLYASAFVQYRPQVAMRRGRRGDRGRDDPVAAPGGRLRRARAPVLAYRTDPVWSRHVPVTSHDPAPGTLAQPAAPALADTPAHAVNVRNLKAVREPLNLGVVSYVDPFGWGGGGELISRELVRAERGHILELFALWPKPRLPRVNGIDGWLLADVQNVPRRQHRVDQRLLRRIPWTSQNRFSRVLRCASREAYILMDNTYVDTCNQPYLPCNGTEPLNVCPVARGKPCFRLETAQLYSNARSCVFLSPLHERVITRLHPDIRGRTFVHRPSLDPSPFSTLGPQSGISNGSGSER